MPTALLYIVLSMVRPSPAAPAPISFAFLNRHETTTLDLFDQNGGERPAALREAKHFLRCWRTEREKSIDPRLLQVISQVSRHFDHATIEVVSGYRARPYGAPHSRHFLGRAMDIRIDGVPARALRDYVWRSFRGVGVGYYPEQGFVHVDVRDVDTGWVDHATHGESAKHVHYFDRPDGQPAPEQAPLAKLARPIAATIALALE
jgi:uncharacterized protein YcbK (DUF882 family)